ncbi:MAG: hypothetical protein RLZZ558_396 [Planctomycetota bacterium]
MTRLWPAVAGAMLATLACLRTLVAISPAIWFDVDPLLTAEAGRAVPMSGIGPAGSLAIDLAMLLVAAPLLWCFAGRAAALVALVAVVPLPAGLLLDESVARLGWRGWDWITAWVACGAAAAVARNPRPGARLAWSAMVATLLGVCGAWMARGVWQWVVEHPDTVAYFRGGAGRDFLQERGWDPEGPQALAYVRRLEQREMLGWFGLSNIFSGVMAVAAVALAGMPRTQGRRGGSWLLLAGACAVAVVLNGGKGAIAAMLIGLAAVGVMHRWRPAPIAVAGVALALVALSALAPLLRGMLPMPALQGERSLLFRWHYLQTAWSAWLERPWTGTGTEGFQDASARLRPATAVELVQSAHAAFVDWVAQLGVGGAAWIAAALALLVWSARGAAMEPAPLPVPPASDGRPQWIVAVVAMAGAMLAIGQESHTLHATDLAVRLVGGAAWAGVAAMLLPRLWSARSCGAHLLFPAALAMLCHAQVEMTLWNAGSAAWLLVLLGAAAPSHGLHPQSAEMERAPRPVPRMLAGATALALAMACLPTLGMQRRMASAMEDVAQQLVRETRPDSPVDAATARRRAADAIRAWSRLLASDQLLRAAVAEGVRSPRGVSDLRAACVDADDAVDRGAGPLAATRLETLQRAALAWLALAEATGEHPDQVGARERALAVVAFEPRATALWLRAARLAQRTRDPRAADFARTAIEVDDSFTLDPLAMLSPRDRAEAEGLAGLSEPWPDRSP